jgi:hypothetical protein
MLSNGVHPFSNNTCNRGKMKETKTKVENYLNTNFYV